MNMPRNVHIPDMLSCRQLFPALPTNTEVEAHKRASADDLYDEQQVCAECNVQSGLKTLKRLYCGRDIVDTTLESGITNTCT